MEVDDRLAGAIAMEVEECIDSLAAIQDLNEVLLVDLALHSACKAYSMEGKGCSVWRAHIHYQ